MPMADQFVYSAFCGNVSRLGVNCMTIELIFCLLQPVFELSSVRKHHFYYVFIFRVLAVNVIAKTFARERFHFTMAIHLPSPTSKCLMRDVSLGR